MSGTGMTKTMSAYSVIVDNERIKTFEAQENLTEIHRRILCEAFAHDLKISPVGVRLHG